MGYFGSEEALVLNLRLSMDSLFLQPQFQTTEKYLENIPPPCFGLFPIACRHLVTGPGDQSPLSLV
jgi:hypothetical protein